MSAYFFLGHHDPSKAKKVGKALMRTFYHSAMLVISGRASERLRSLDKSSYGSDAGGHDLESTTPSLLAAVLPHALANGAPASKNGSKEAWTKEQSLDEQCVIGVTTNTLLSLRTFNGAFVQACSTEILILLQGTICFCCSA